LTEIVGAFQNADGNLQQAITDLAVSSAQAVSNEATARQTADNAIIADLAAEVSRATGVEAGLAADLVDETAAREAADTIIAASVTAEATARAAADTALQTAINAEAATRAAADTAHATAIADEAAARAAADAIHAAAIADETTARQSADTTLQGNINAEAATRAAADTALGQRIDDLNTDQVAEGTTNKYFTTVRARESISATGSLSYNSASGVISYTTPNSDGIVEGSTNMYFTDSRARNAVSLTTDNTDALSYNSATGQFTFNLASVDTGEIAEGSNLYFTTDRARNSLVAGSNISYDAATGTISTQAAVWSVNGQTHDAVLDTDNINEGSANMYFTQARARGAVTLTSDNSDILSYNSGTGAFTFVTPSTDAIAEGVVNQYFTNARADGRIAAASIRDLADVNKTAAMQDGYTLVWNSFLQEFVPQNVAVQATTLNFTGDGTTLSFSTGVEVTSIDNTQVYINGLIQAPTYSYTISTTGGVTSIVFDAAPEANDYIFVRVSSTNTLSAGGVLNEGSQIDGGTY
jgi:hypothetical protein